MTRMLNAAAWLILLAIVGSIIGLGYLIYRLAENTVRTIDSTWGPAFYQIGAGALLVAFVLLVIGGAVIAVQWLARRSRQIGAQDGLYPVMDGGRGQYVNINEPGAQSLAVMAAASHCRPTAAMVGRVVDGHYRAMEQPTSLPAPYGDLTVDDVTAVDPRTAPHWLLVGKTGSGKTSASFAILAQLARRAPCQFVIVEPGGVNWGSQALATDTQTIAPVVQGVQREMERRMELLSQADGVSHVQDLAHPAPYLVLLVEEMDALLDDLRLTDRDVRTATIIALRNIARRGRQVGICLVAVSQSGTTDVFDAHVRKNISNVLLFASEHTVADTWRLSGVRLSTYPAGMAYSVSHGTTVQFPRVQRPLLPRWQNPLELPEPKQTSIPVSDWPGASAVSSLPLLPRREPTPEDNDLIRQVVAASRSKNEAVFRLYGSKDGKTLAWVNSALAQPQEETSLHAAQALPTIATP